MTIGFEIEYRRCLIGTAYTIRNNYTGESNVIINKYYLEQEVDKLLATNPVINL